jgi:hypothetical protein
MRINIQSAFCLLLWCTAGLVGFVAGCGSAKVSNETQSAVAAARPDVVYVGTVDLGAATVRSDPGTLTGRPRLLRLRNEDPAAELEKLQELLANELVNDLTRAGLSAQRLSNDGPRPTQGWLVSGAFLELQEGNRLQRAVIGFGVGSADEKLYVAVADLAHPEGQKLLDFNADTSGNKVPGGAVAEAAAHSPWAMVGKYVMERNTSEKDIRRVAQAISDEIVAFAGKK